MEERARLLASLFREPTRSPMWTRSGVFVFPPQALWKRLGSGFIRRAWDRAVRAKGPDPAGLYVNIPPKTRASALLESLRVLDLPKSPAFRTLYVGSGGSGELSRFSADEIEGFYGWLMGRFRWGRLRQSTVEADPSALDAEKVRVLVRHRVDRLTCFLSKDRKSFARGIRLCRRLGLKNINVDVSARTDLDARFLEKLDVDNSMLWERAGESAGKDTRKPGTERKGLLNNLQLVHAFQYNASILGLGPGAVSHVRGGCVYSDGMGARLTLQDEKRAHIIRSLEDVGHLDRGIYRRAFREEPEDTFPREFAGLVLEGRLVETGEGFEARGDRNLSAVRLYGGELLRALLKASNAEPDML